MTIQETLTDIFGGKSLDELDSHYRCTKCWALKKSWKELDPHHVTYEPHFVKFLCRRCHARITYLNSLEASRIGKKLDAETRMRIWNKFLKEDIIETRYEKSLLWFNDFCERINKVCNV